MKARISTLAFLVIAMLISASAQQGKWATDDDKTAKWMIASERQWAESACVKNGIAEKILADDFQGTSTLGKRTTKADEVNDTPDATQCKLDEAKVRFFGDNIALIYGAESRFKKGEDGSDKKLCQVWTDTWLKRDGKWQIVAAQDTRIPCK